MSQQSKHGLKQVAPKLGRLFSKFEYLLKMLLGYVGLSLVLSIILLAMHCHDIGFDRTCFIAFSISSGSDPYNFEAILRPNRLSWTSALIMHLLSWLIVPVLIAGAVDAAFRSFELKRLDKEKVLKEQLRIIGVEVLKLEGPALEKYVDDSYRRLIEDKI